jgi:hypothetical protein
VSPSAVRRRSQTADRLAAACILASALVAFAAPAAFSGAWVQKSQSYYFKISASYLYSEKELNFDGDKVDILSGKELLTNTSYSDLGVNVYVEYGLTDRLTLLGVLPFKVLTSKRTEVADVVNLRRQVETINGGLSDLALGLRYPIVVEPFPVSVQGNVKLPLGYDDEPDNNGPPLGSGRADMEAHLLAGVSLYPFPAYVTGGAGYRVRTGDLEDEFLFAVEAGATWKRLMARVGLDGLYSTGNPPDLTRSDTGQVSSAVVITNQDILKLTPALGVLLNTDISLVFEAFHVIDGKNTVAGTTYAVGVVYQQ